MTRTRTYARPSWLAALVLSTLFPIDALTQGNTAQIAGRVTDASGAVITGVTVEAVRSSRPVASTTTGGEGRYALTVPAGVRIELRARREGFAEFALDLPGQSSSLVRDIVLQVGRASDTVVVTAAGIPESRAAVTASVTVMTPLDLHAVGASQLSDALRFVPGLAVEGTGREGGLISAFSRGGESDYNLVLMDGVRVNQQGGLFDFSRVSAGEIERVEVVRGAQSALWGSDAMGSVVQIFTRRTRPGDGPRVSGSVEGGTFGTWRGNARLTAAAGRAEYQAGVTHRRTDGAFGDVLPENDWFEATAFDGGLGVAIGNGASLRTSLRYCRDQGRNVGSITFGARDTQGTYDTKNLSWSTNVAHVLGSRFTGTATVNYFRYTQVTADTFADPSFTTYAVLEGTPGALFPHGVRLVRLVDEAEFTTLVGAGATPGQGQFLASASGSDFPGNVNRVPTVFDRPAARYQGDYAWASGHRLSVGYEWERESFDPLDSAPLSTGFALDNNAVFLQQQSGFGGRWFVSVGLRVDRKESYDTFVSPKLSAGGFVLPLRDGAVSSVKVFGNVGKGVKSPLFGERFGSGFADPNPELRPERARTTDLGLEATFASQRLRGTVTYFNNDYADQIAFRFGTTGDGIPEFINIDLSEADGWELEGALQRPVFGFTASGSYSNVDSRVVTNLSTSQQFLPGQPLLRRPRHSGFVRAAYGAGRATVHVDVRMVGDRHDNSFLFMRTVPNAQYGSAFTTDITVNPGYTVAGLGVDVQVDRDVSLYVRGNNITNTSYDTALGYPGMPRTMMVGARFNIGRRP
jgi:outer membrane cobalamin receptor